MFDIFLQDLGTKKQSSYSPILRTSENTAGIPEEFVNQSDTQMESGRCYT